MKKGFTLLELVVAVGILAMMLGFISIIFKVSLKGSRVVGANAEIMQKLRGVTDQIDNDLRGLDKDAPLLIWFENDSVNTGADNRVDQMMFFALGDFQSTQLYDGSGEPVDPANQSSSDYINGVAARIYYGQAQGTADPAQTEDVLFERIICRRRHILTDDENTQAWPTLGSAGAYLDDFDASMGPYSCDDRYEHDRLDMTDWKEVDEEAFRRYFSDGVVRRVFENRPEVKLGDELTYHNLLSENVGSFKIQWGYWNPEDDHTKKEDDEIRWFPSDDPERDANPRHSHFPVDRDDPARSRKLSRFGVYFNVPYPVTGPPNEVFSHGVGADKRWWYPIGDDVIHNFNPAHTLRFEDDFYPKALKFTFTIYDSKGVIEDGRTFTHIVYLGE